MISDPFRLRPAVSWLREPFLDLAKGHAELTRRMQRLLPDISADGLSVDEWFERLDERADFQVESKYPFLKSRAPLVHEHLLRVLRQKAKIEEAIMKGYTGDICQECGQVTMVRNGTCLKCMSCGSTSGCS